MLSLLPAVACASAIELDGPLAQITNPAYAAATSQPKSIRMRRATSRASSPATTSPNPQLSQHAIAQGRTLRRPRAAAWSQAKRSHSSPRAPARLDANA